MPQSIDETQLGRNSHYTQLETSQFRPGLVSNINRIWWAVNGTNAFHKIDNTLEIGASSIVSTFIKGGGTAVEWHRSTMDLPVGDWSIDAMGFRTTVVAFLTQRDWFETKQHEFAAKHAVFPARNWQQFSAIIANTAIKTYLHDLILAGKTTDRTATGELIHNGLFRAVGMPVIEEPDSLNQMQGLELWRKLIRYINRFRMDGLIRPENIRVLIPESMIPALEEPIFATPDTRVGGVETVASRLQRRLMPESPTYISSIHPILELNSFWLEKLNIHPPNTDKNRIIIQCDLPLSPDELGTRQPQIGRCAHPLNRLPVDRTSLNESQIYYAATSELIVEHEGLTLAIDYPNT
jgi:hypothetical protein